MTRTTSSLLRAHSRGSFARLILESEQCNGPIGQGHNPRSISFRVCQFIVFLFRLVTPFSYIFLLYVFLRESSPRLPNQWQNALQILDKHLFSSLKNPSPTKVWTFNSISPIHIGIYGEYSITFTLFTLWMCVEAAFLPYYYYLFTLLNSLNDDLKHFASDRESRRTLVQNCFKALRTAANTAQGQSPEQYIRKVTIAPRRHFW